MANILITGASRGIGFELTKLFLANGHKVVAVSRNTSSLEQITHANLKLITFDLSSNNFTDLITEVNKFSPHIDLLINNAGAIVNKPFSSITTEDLQKVYGVNVFGVIKLIQSLLPNLLLAQSAHIVSISSMGGFQGASKFAGLSAYSSSKAALACLSECLAEEYKDTQLKFNSLCIGAVQTEMLTEAFPGYEAPTTPSQMASYIYQFGMQAHQFINGKTLPISLSTP